MTTDLIPPIDPNNRDPTKGPFPLVETSAHRYGKLPEYHPCNEMSLAHNTMARGLNAIYLQCTSITAHQDIQDFLLYCQIWYEFTHHHHTYEEKFLFPALERELGRPGLMITNMEQHEAFHNALDSWGQKCYNIQPEQYDGHALRAGIDQFASALVTHLHDEIRNLETIVQKSSEADIKKMQGLWKQFNDTIAGEVSKFRIYPYALSAWDCNFENGMHRFPDGPVIINYVIDWLFAWKHRGAWRFAPSDMYSRPRPLTYAEPLS